MKFQHKTCSGTVRFCNWKLKSGMKCNKIVFSSFLSQIENHVHWVLNFPVNSVFAYDSRNSFWADLLKVAFSQNILMHLSFSQTYEPFIFLNMKIWILGICQPTMTFFPLQVSKMSNFKTFSISKQISGTKIQIFKLRKIYHSYVWGNDKCISTSWKKSPLTLFRLACVTW